MSLQITTWYIHCVFCMVYIYSKNMCKKSTLIARTHRHVTLASYRPRGCKRRRQQHHTSEASLEIGRQ